MDEKTFAPSVSSTERARPKVRRRRRRIFGPVLLVLAALAIVALAVVALRPKPVPVDVASVRRGSVELAVTEDGRTRIKDRYAVVAPVAGKMERIGLRAGDRVEKGAVIASIVPLDAPLLDDRTSLAGRARVTAAAAAGAKARAAVAGAEAALALAKREAARSKTLYDSGAISAADLERVDTEVRLRQAELDAAKLSVDVAASEEAAARASIDLGPPEKRKKEPLVVAVRAPVAGVVLRVVTESAGPVLLGAPLIEIGDPSNLEIVVDVLTTDAVRMKPDGKAMVVGWGGADLAAHVRTISPSAVTKLSALGIEEQRVDVVLDLDEPADRFARLGDGFAVDASIAVDRADDALIVPVGAVFKVGSGYAVYVVDATGAAKQLPVEIILQSSREVAVRADVRESDRVVLHPSDRVKDGVRVAVR